MFNEALSKNKFALSEYNLGYINEYIHNNEEQSIKYYKDASRHEKEPFEFHGKECLDHRLEASKIFIICFTDLKLTRYFFNSNPQESKQYFIKALNKFTLDKNDLLYKFPFGNKTFEFDFNVSSNNRDDCELYDERLEKLAGKSKIINKKLINYQNLRQKNYPAKLFESICKDDNLKKSFLTQIDGIIKEMHDELYKYPYSILFGRTCFNRHGFNNKCPPPINNLFYEGFGIDEFCQK